MAAQFCLRAQHGCTVLALGPQCEPRRLLCVVVFLVLFYRLLLSLAYLLRDCYRALVNHINIIVNFSCAGKARLVAGAIANLVKKGVVVPY